MSASMSSSRCANCGTPLASAGAICLRCDGEFSPPAVDPTVGKYRCPSCSGRFDSTHMGPWPPNAKWYWPQDEKPKCPHCGIYFRDKTLPPLTRVEIAIVAVLFNALFFLPWRPVSQLALLGVVGAMAFFRKRRAKASVATEEDRYAIEKQSSHNG